MITAGSYPQNRCLIMDILRKLKPKSILDMGMGTGYYGEMIRRDFPEIKLDGVEIFEDYKNELWDFYDNIYHEDIKTMKFDYYDVYLMVDIIEHLTKEEGLELLRSMEKDRVVLISTPWYYPQDEVEGNPYQKHLSKWLLRDFEEFEYRDFSNDLSIVILLKT